MLDKNGKIKIIDFGLSTQVKPGQMLNQQCGASSFGAPDCFSANDTREQESHMDFRSGPLLYGCQKGPV